MVCFKKMLQSTWKDNFDDMLAAACISCITVLCFGNWANINYVITLFVVADFPTLIGVFAVGSSLPY